MTYIFGSGIVLCMILIAVMVKSAFENRLVHKKLEFEEFPVSFGEINILFISDIHRRKISQVLLNQIKKKIDIVIIGGDLVERGVPLSRVRQNLDMLNKIAPTYFVWGNNDYEIDYHELDALLLEKGIKVLANEAVLFESYGNEAMVLLGVDDVGLNRDDLDLALQKGKELQEDAFRILVSHNPAIVSKIKVEDNISLVLSGHTHGGQIRLFGLGMYEKGGIHKLGNTFLLVSNGYGTTTLPMRLGAASEGHVITLLKK